MGTVLVTASFLAVAAVGAAGVWGWAVGVFLVARWVRGLFVGLEVGRVERERKTETERKKEREDERAERRGRETRQWEGRRDVTVQERRSEERLEKLEGDEGEEKPVRESAGGDSEKERLKRDIAKSLQ
jgi:hypothetical protein